MRGIFLPAAQLFVIVNQNTPFNKDETAKINAALKAKHELKRTAGATEEISQMISNIDLANL